MSDSTETHTHTNSNLTMSDKNLDDPEEIYEAANTFLKQVISSHEHLAESTSNVEYLTNENTNRTSVRLTTNQKNFVENLKKTEATTSREIAIGICVGFAMNYQDEFNDYLSEYLLRSLDHTFEPESQNSTTDEQDSEPEEDFVITEEDITDSTDAEEQAKTEISENAEDTEEEDTEEEIEFDDDPDGEPFGGKFDVDDI